MIDEDDRREHAAIAATADVVDCPALVRARHPDDWQRLEGERNRRLGDATRVAVIALKVAMVACDEEGERRALRSLRALGHPDVEGLIQATRDKMRAPASRRRAL